MVSYGDQIRGIWGLYGSHVGFAEAARYLHLHLVIIFVLTSIFRPPSSTTTTTTTTSISTSSSVSAYTLHYGLTGGWVQEFKASYLAYFLQCALTDYDSGKA